MTYSPQVKFGTEKLIINLPPNPVISHPLHNATFVYGDPIVFDATNSTDDGVSGVLMFTWRSSWNGYIGYKDTFVRHSPLLLGMHSITLYLDDGQYNITTSISIYIIEGDPTVYVNPDKLDNVNDTDGDGMLDSWEITHFGDLTTSDGKKDTDGDGYSDLQEYLYASDPWDETDTPPAVVEPDMKKKEDDVEKTFNYGWWILLVALVLLILGGVIFYFYMQKKEKESEMMGDNVMMVRGKTRDDLDEEERPYDEDDEDYPEIERKSRKQQTKERKALYGKKGKRGKKKKSKQIGPEIEESPVDDDEFGESDMDMETLDDEFDEDFDEPESEFDDDFDDDDDFLDDDLDGYDEPKGSSRRQSRMLDEEGDFIDDKLF